MRSSNIWICVVLSFCQFFKRIFFFSSWIFTKRICQSSLLKQAKPKSSESDSTLTVTVLWWIFFYYCYKAMQYKTWPDFNPFMRTALQCPVPGAWNLVPGTVYQVWPPVTMVMRARQGVMCADRILLHLRNRISCNSYCVVSLECAELCEAEKSAMKSRFQSVCGQVTYSTRVNRRAWSRWPFFITSKCNQWENI